MLLHFDLLPETTHLLAQRSLQRVQSLPATKATETVLAGIPRAFSFRLTSRDHSPTCLAVLATRSHPACNKSHRNCFGGDPPRFFISTYFQKTPTFLPSGPCHAKPNNHRPCCKSMAFLQMQCILLVAKQTKTKWSLPLAAWPTQHKMLSIQSPKPHLADSMLVKYTVRLPLRAFLLLVPQPVAQS